MEIEFYKTVEGKVPVADFLDGLPDKDMAKVFREIDLLAEYGAALREPHTKHVDGLIWELRTKFSTNIYRIFYFTWRDNNIVLLHGFTKKTRKTPGGELKTAKRRLDDYITRARCQHELSGL